MLARQAPPHHHAPRHAPDDALAAALDGAAFDGDCVTPSALDAVAAYAWRARAAGRSPRQLAIAVRRSLAHAVPAAMTAVTFDAVARTLVRHALRHYFRA